MSNLYQYNGKKWTEIGKDGKTPIPGVDFELPLNGKDGSPDKPKEIAEKLNTLEGIIKPEVIKGLKKEFEKFAKAINVKVGGGGSSGGMGEIQHETFDTDATTTSVTLSNKVAGNGSAIWLRYQGQMLHWGEHYTVSSKTISILETLSNNTKLEVTYIRS